jgi:hypothetical protein
VEFSRSIAQVVARRFIVAAVCAAAFLCLQSKREFELSQPSNFSPHANVLASDFDTGKKPDSLVFADTRTGIISSRLIRVSEDAEFHVLSRGAGSAREIDGTASRLRSPSALHVIASGAGTGLEIGTTDFRATQLEAEKPSLAEIGSSLHGARAKDALS